MNITNSNGRVRKTNNFLKMYREHELNNNKSIEFKNCAKVNESMLNRLKLIGSLNAHNGCVNCLEWSEDGRYLISGSDDTKVIIWDPFISKPLSILSTRHIGNIFSVKFLPKSNSTQIVTAGADCIVTVINVESYSLDINNSLNGAISSPTPILLCRCHNRRVKRIATAPNVPNLFWTAGEDGLVMQYDLRVAHSCPSNGDGSNGPSVIIDLQLHNGITAEAKCIAINPIKPDLMAIGSNDPYARIFDRRMIKPVPYRSSFHSVESQEQSENIDERYGTYMKSINSNCANYFAPGCLVPPPHTMKNLLSDRLSKYATTYLTFSPDGTQLLVNLGGDYIYLYDINGDNNNYKRLFINPNLVSDNDDLSQIDKCCNSPVISEEVDVGTFEIETETLGISVHSYEEILSDPSVQCSCHFIKRADLFMKRRFTGDFYAAARDYMYALQLRGGIKQKLSFRPIVGLIYSFTNLKWLDIAKQWLNILRENYENKSSICKHLERLINTSAATIETERDSESETSFFDKIFKQKIKYEETWKHSACDYKQRFIGHCNITTDIKEANFLGDRGEFITAGSDDGNLYFWRSRDGKIINAIPADASIVNCVQMHPSSFTLATSGIENVVKLWQPSEKEEVIISPIDLKNSIMSNQRKITIDPGEHLFSNIGIIIDSDSFRGFAREPSCHTS